MSLSKEKLFVVRKYVMAKSASDAIQKERQYPVDDVWVDDDWKKSQENPGKPIGYHK